MTAQLLIPAAPALTPKATQLSRFLRVMPWIAAVGGVGTQLFLQAPAFLVGVSTSLLAYKILRAIAERCPRLKQGLSQMKLTLASWPVLGTAMGIGAWLQVQLPSHALFFSAAEDHFIATFPQAAATAPLVFNTLRAILLLYLAVALIGVINAVRNDDDWQTAARLPLLVALIVGVGEWLTNLIIA